jgi:hypothetical protein
MAGGCDDEPRAEGCHDEPGDERHAARDLGGVLDEITWPDLRQGDPRGLGPKVADLGIRVDDEELQAAVAIQEKCAVFHADDEHLAADPKGRARRPGAPGQQGASQAGCPDLARERSVPSRGPPPSNLRPAVGTPRAGAPARAARGNRTARPSVPGALRAVLEAVGTRMHGPPALSLDISGGSASVDTPFGVRGVLRVQRLARSISGRGVRGRRLWSRRPM